MNLEIWVGLVELRQLPGKDQKVALSGKGAFTWITCWATDAASFQSRVTQVMTDYGFFIVDIEKVMPFASAEEEGILSDELIEQFEDTSKNERFCIYGTFHSYKSDH
jgi:hypothetical protein